MPETFSPLGADFTVAMLELIVLGDLLSTCCDVRSQGRGDFCMSSASDFSCDIYESFVCEAFQ